MTTTKPPVPTRYTMDSLATLATCRRRFEIEHVKNFRPRYWSDGLYPPSIKDVLRLTLAKRDELLLKGFSQDQIWTEMQWQVGNWANNVHKNAPMLGFKEKTQLAIDIGKIYEDALGIIKHYLFAWPDEEQKAIHITRKKTQFDLCNQEIIIRLRKNGRRTKWSYACQLDSVLGHSSPVLMLRHFTSSSFIKKISKNLRDSSWWIGHVLAASEITGKRIEQVVFDIVRTVSPSTPKAVICTRCKGSRALTGKDGTVICPNCKGTGYWRISKAPCAATTRTLEAFHVQHPYIEIKEDLRNKLTRSESSFAWRYPLTVDWSRVEDWQRNAIATIQEGVAARRNGYWPRNVKACNVPGRRCPYRGPCNRPLEYADVAPYKKVESENYVF